MKPMTGNRRIALMAVLGALFGYLFLHPYTMVVYELHGAHGEEGGLQGAVRLFSNAAASFSPNMLPMGIPFALLGGVAGLFFGFWLNARARRFEEEKRLLAAETARQLTVTLSHHLLNAVQGIGGFAASVIRKEQDDDLKRRVELIRGEARKIEAVVKTLQSLETVATERYIGSSETMMIDIRNELRDALKEASPERKR